MGHVGTGWTGTGGSPYWVGLVGMGQGDLQIWGDRIFFLNLKVFIKE